jgi:peptidoglycan/xylan/chitin deacetylase (PgdA/CDA1 family)
MFKQLALSLLARPSIGRMLRPLGRGRAAVIMMHRFSTAHGDHAGHAPHELERVLEELRAIGARFVPIEEIAAFADGASHSEQADPVVAFTVDDGYADFAQVGLPIFQKFSCPVTCYVVPAVVDGRHWFWWDQLDWVARHAVLAGTTVRCTVRDFDGDFVPGSVPRLVESLKVLQTKERETLIEELARDAGVTFPTEIPSAYAVMSWDDMRRVESPMVRFGAHTETHPILGRCDDDRARAEIEESCRRVRTELRYPSPVFCYPNGMPGDFGSREWQVLRSIPGFVGAVAAVPRVALRSQAASDPNWRWQIPRFAFDGRPGVMTRLLYL